MPATIWVVGLCCVYLGCRILVSLFGADVPQSVCTQLMSVESRGEVVFLADEVGD
jgi:hypothetical protein